MDNLILSDEMLQQQVCTLCFNYLSVGPVLVSCEGETICGRCSSNKTHTGCSRSLFNLVAEKLVFKCINWYDGCSELLLFNEATEHEKKCKKTQLKCPFQDFEGNGCQLIHHIRTKHQNVMVGDTFKIIFEQKILKNVILVKNGSIFCLLINVVDKFIEIYSWLLTPCNWGSEHFKLRFFKSDSNVEFVSPIIKIGHQVGNFPTSNELDTKSCPVKNRFLLDQASIVDCFSSTWSLCKIELVDGDCDMERTILQQLYFKKIIDKMDTKLPSNTSETRVAKAISDNDSSAKYRAVCENDLDTKTSKCKVPCTWNNNYKVQHKWYDDLFDAQYDDHNGDQYNEHDDDQYDNQCDDHNGDQCDVQYDDHNGDQYNDHDGDQYDIQCDIQYDDQYDDHTGDQYNDHDGDQYDIQCDIQYDDQYDDHTGDLYYEHDDDQYDNQCDVQYDDQYDDHNGDLYNEHDDDQYDNQCDVQYDDQYDDHNGDQYNDHDGDQYDNQCDIQYDDHNGDQYNDHDGDQYDNQCDVQYDDQYDNQCDVQYDDHYGDQYDDYGPY